MQLKSCSFLSGSFDFIFKIKVSIEKTIWFFNCYAIMKQVIKHIMFLVLIVGLYTAVSSLPVKGNFSNESFLTLFATPQESSFDKNDLPYPVTAEFGSIGVQTYQLQIPRIQRTSFSRASFSLKDITQFLSERDTSLLAYYWKSYNPFVLLSIVYPTCEYYVFALRHIII